MAAEKKRSNALQARELETYQFNTSSYVIVKKGTRRDSSTGRLVPTEKISRTPATKKAN